MRSRNGPPEAVRIRRRISLWCRPCRHWWMALCSLSTGRIATPWRRAAAVTSAPAITSTSLLASAIVLPASIAASTASRPAVPDDAHMHDVHGGMRGHRDQPFGATGHRGAHVRAARRTKTVDALARRHRDDVGPIARTCSASSGALSPAASATTFRRSGCASTTASALRPIDPVEPRMASRFT